MTRTISLDTRSINRLISELEEFKDRIGEELVNILCIEGADEANIAYGNMAQAQGFVESADEGKVVGQIIATSDNEDHLLIAEFGAGDATIDPRMEFETHELDAWVFPGAYSLFKGRREYWYFHSWEFPAASGHWYTEVPARHGMFNAKLYVMNNFERLAEEVIRLD